MIVNLASIGQVLQTPFAQQRGREPGTSRLARAVGWAMTVSGDARRKISSLAESVCGGSG
jgi:hypothetical protein